MGIKARMKVAVDVAMTVLLMLLMAFELIGRVAHEWIGVGMLFLFIVHHVFNWKWSKGLFKGKYTPFRVLQTILAFLVFFACWALWSARCLSPGKCFLSSLQRRSVVWQDAAYALCLLGVCVPVLCIWEFIGM